MSNVENITPLNALDELQKHFCIIDLEGQIRILDRVQVSNVKLGIGAGGIGFYKKPDGEMLMRRCLESLPVLGKPNDAIKDFWINPSTHMYNQTAFTPETTPDTTVNFWCSYTAVASPANWQVIKQYLYHVICDGNASSYQYLVRFLAHMVQKPEEKPGIIVTLLGGQGTGKGVFFQLLRAIWSRTTLQVTDLKEVLGQFTAPLERNYIVCMDEALFKGDRRGLDRLKSLVTEPVIRIEQKFEPSRSIESVHRFFAASNHAQVAHIESDDRRFFFLRVSDIYQQDTDYFKTVCGAIEDEDVIGGMVYDLESLSLKSFDVRKRPKTKEHAKQKLKSLQGFELYWYEILCTGEFVREDYVEGIWTDSLFRSSDSLLLGYKSFDKQAGRFSPVQQSEISKTIKKVCPSAKGCRTMIVNRQRRGFTLPSIEVARQEFEQYIELEIDWDDVQ